MEGAKYNMKKLLLAIILPIALFTSCSDKNSKVENNQQNTSNVQVKSDPEIKINISDYYPIKENIEYKFAGEGNEYAAKDVYVDYIKDNKVQLRIITGGTTSINIVERTDDAVTLLNSNGEIYHKTNYIDSPSDFKKEILIKSPIKVGTSWTIPNGYKRSITALDKVIKTPIGDLKALEIKTEGKEHVTWDYYVKDMGHVKTVYEDSKNPDFKVITEIKEIKGNTPLTQNVKFYYIKSEPTEFITAGVNRDIKLNTNQDVNESFEKYLKSPENKELIPAFSKNTKINKIGINLDNNIAYIDLSKEFVNEMNAGSEVEARKVEAVAYTVGNYYNSKEVLLTVDGEPYAGGHIAFKKGETIKIKQ